MNPLTIIPGFYIRKECLAAFFKVLVSVKIEVEHSYDTATILVDTLFLIILTSVDILDELSGAMLLSPDLRYEVKNFESYAADYHFLKVNDIHTVPQLETSIGNYKAQIASLEADRQKISNKIRRSKTPEETVELKIRRKDITKKITPLRKQLCRGDRTLEKFLHLYEFLRQEHHMEKAKMKIRGDRFR